MGLFTKVTCGVCGSTIRGQYVKVNNTSTGKLLYNLCPNCNQKFRLATKDKVAYPPTSEEAKKLIEGGVNASGVIEIRKRCNLCGEVFCYSDKDLARNRELLKKATDARMSAAMEAIGGTRLASNQETARADSFESQIVDYSKCPKCNSTDLIDIGDEEYKRIVESKSNPSNSSSAADEIKKFKDLLDAGVITQEEFDAKKKQLLGL